MSKLSIGIVGLPNVGKSTLFSKVTKNEVDAQNYPFCTIDPNVGVVAVPDERLAKLTKLSSSAKTIPAVVELYDIAGLVRGANKGEGLGNQFLSHIRDTDAIVMVLRIFSDSGVIHVEDTVDPVRDMEIIQTELALKDLETIERVVKKAQGEARTGDKMAQKTLDLINEIRRALEAGNNVMQVVSEEALSHPKVRELNLLSTKKQFYLLNGKEEEVPAELTAKISERKETYIVSDLSGEDDLNALITEAYRTLGLISFFTTGEDETRAWTITQGACAPQAAGVIHTDFENKFIRAEVINWEKLLEVGSWQAAKQKGVLRVEGKDYVVDDGDVMVIRHG